jgi:hypothetical protein
MYECSNKNKVLFVGKKNNNNNTTIQMSEVLFRMNGVAENLSSYTVMLTLYQTNIQFLQWPC